MNKLFLLCLTIFGIVTLSGCETSISNAIIDGTGSALVTDAVSNNSGAIDQVVSLMGNSKGTNYVFPQFEEGRFFTIAHDRSRQSEFDVFDRNNVGSPLYTISLPQTTTGKYVTWASDKPIFFDNHDMYIIAYFQINNAPVGDPDYILFQISFTGNVIPIANLGKNIPLGAGMEPVIDNIAKKIVRLSYSEGRLIIFDIITKAMSYISYPNVEGLVIKNLRSYEDTIAMVEVGKPGQDGGSNSTKFVTINILTSNVLQELSSDQYTRLWESRKKIQYKDCDIGGTCTSFIINGKSYVYTGGIYFTDLIDNNLFGRYDGSKDEGNRRFVQGLPMYAFIPINQL